MKPLGVVTPTPEQLTVIDDGSPGFWLIRGAAGSGKTTTALLRLKFLVRLWRERAKELGASEPVRVLVLTLQQEPARLHREPGRSADPARRRRVPGGRDLRGMGHQPRQCASDARQGPGAEAHLAGEGGGRLLLGAEVPRRRDRLRAWTTPAGGSGQIPRRLKGPGAGRRRAWSGPPASA